MRREDSEDEEYDPDEDYDPELEDSAAAEVRGPGCRRSEDLV